VRLRIDSIRLRLTLWYAVLLAVALGAMAVATYSLLDGLASRRATWSMQETTGTVLATGERRPGGLEEAVRAFRAPDRRVLLVAPDGSVRAASQPLTQGPPVSREVFRAVPGRALLSTVTAGRRPVSVRARLRPGDPTVRVSGRRLRRRGDVVLAVVASTRPEDELREQARIALAIAVAATLLLAVIPGSLLVRRSLSPVGDMTRQAARIGAERLGDRLPVRNPRDELGALALVLNDLLDRLQRAFDQQRRLMAEAAHELRTPVAVVRAEAELALSAQRTGPEYREALGLVGSEAERLGRIVDDLLTYSRAEAGQHPLRLSDADLAEVAADATRALRSVAAQKGVELRVDAGEELPMRADADLLARMVVNLVENAVKHGRPGDHVTVQAAREGAAYRLCVRDTGPGVPDDSRGRIFEPFYRGSRARADGSGGGAGLGLPIARWIAEAHGGRLELVESGPAGSLFRATFPASSADPSALP
jgi:two-component system OmpR family sensor kinase